MRLTVDVLSSAVLITSLNHGLYLVYLTPALRAICKFLKYGLFTISGRVCLNRFGLSSRYVSCYNRKNLHHATIIREVKSSEKPVLAFLSKARFPN